MTAAWFPGNALAFDTEATGPHPDTDHIVSAHLVEVGPEGSGEWGSWLVNPGVPIPPEATAVHGITNEQAQTGMAPAEALQQICDDLTLGWSRGLPLIAMNASYDLTLLQAELVRVGLPVLQLGPVLDPQVIDRACDRFRKGKRKLTDLALHYTVKQDTAHSAAGDAITAARVVWRQSQKYTQIAHLSLEAMQHWQRLAHLEWAAHYERHLLEKGTPAEIPTAWPVRRAA